MGYKEDLISEWGQLTVKEMELKAEYDKLGPQVNKTWVFNLEELEQLITIETEIESIRKRKREIQETLGQLKK